MLSCSNCCPTSTQRCFWKKMLPRKQFVFGRHNHHMIYVYNSNNRNTNVSQNNNNNNNNKTCWHRHHLYHKHQSFSTMITTTTTTPTTVTVTKSIPEIRTLPVQYLRAMDTSCFHPITQQRTDCFFDKETGQPSSSSTSKRSQQQQPTTNATTTTTTATTTTVNDHDGTNTNCRHNNVTIQECTLQGDCYRIIWSDGMISNYSLQWVQSTIQQWKGKAEIEPTNKNSYNDRHLWTGFTEEHIRSSSSFMCIPYKDVVSEQNGMFLALQTLYQYGILLVTNTPIQDQGVGIAVLAAALGGGSYQKRNNSTSLLHHYQNPMNISQDNHTDPVSMSIVLPHGTDGPMRTLYGTVWSTNTTGQSAGASIADSAYGQDSLPLHTDLTYYRDPPGLQIFTMIQPSRKDHDGGGGTSIFADGFAAAEILRQQNPDAFTTLTQTIRRYRCIDQMTGWHLEANGPIVQTNVMGQVVQIRHNDLDRMPDLPSSLADNVDDFYRRLDHAHEVWDSVLGRDDIRLQMQLQSGDTMVVANQRCLHGRTSFQASSDAPRSIAGCYVSQDELNSRFRECGFQNI